MGVGRNLAYRKGLFFESGGFTHLMNKIAGDDDLFVNHVATKTNTAVVLSRDSFTWSLPKKTMKECAKELGASEKTLDDWVVRCEAAGKVGSGRTEGQRALDEANRRIVIEAQAHRFASALLMPEQEFVDSLYTVSLEGYRELKPYWKTSIAAMVGLIAVLGYMLDYIAPDTSWHDKMKKLLQGPEEDDSRCMGFGEGWRECPMLHRLA
jgi:hypothetical protein